MLGEVVDGLGIGAEVGDVALDVAVQGSYEPLDGVRAPQRAASAQAVTDPSSAAASSRSLPAYG